MSDSKIKLSDFLKISLLLIVPLLQNCSTIQIADRIGKDIHLEEPDYKKLQGIYLDSIIVDYPKKTTDTISFAYAPCKVELEPLTPKRLKFTYYINDSLVHSKVLKGHFEEGYFMQKTKFGVEFNCGPLLWGSGTENKAYGITTENNLIIKETHGGIALFIIIPFFAGGGDSENEYKRIE